MKKTLYITASVSLLLLAAVSCSKSDVRPATPATIAESLEFVYPGTEEAKIYVDENGSPTYPMIKGETVQFSYSISPAPEKLTHPEVEYVSSDPGVVTVSEDGRITALEEGKATVSLKTATVNLGVTSTLLVKVSEKLIPAESVKVTDDATEVDETYGLPKIAVGEEMHLTASISPSGATYRTVLWSSGDESIATVDRISGTVKGLSKGRVTMKATTLDGSGVSAEHEIFIDKIVTPEGIALIDVPAQGYVCSVTDAATAIQFKLTPEESTRSMVEWVSGDPSIATVSNKGVVTILKYGKVTVTATCPGTESIPEGYTKSVSVTFNIPAGFYREHFEDGSAPHWALNASHVKSGATQEYKEGTPESWMLFTPYLNASKVGRGDIVHDSGSKTYISPDYPILTFRIDDVNDRTWDKSGTPTKYSRNINIDVSGNIDEGSGAKYSGNLGGGNNKWASKLKCSDGSAIIIYDLTTQGFGSTGILPAGSVCWMNTFQIKYADINKNGNSAVKASDINYRMFWFHTFTSYDEMNSYLKEWSEKTGITYE